jgi:hypothetical protein
MIPLFIAMADAGTGNAFVTGYIYSIIFPTQNPYQTYQGPSCNYNAIVARLGVEEPPPNGTISGIVIEINGTTPIKGVLVGALQGGIEVARDTTGPDGTCLFSQIQLGFMILWLLRWDCTRHSA